MHATRTVKKREKKDMAKKEKGEKERERFGIPLPT